MILPGNNMIRGAISDNAWLIYGANTDVGKTIITAAMSRVLVEMNMQVRYIKPVQTGLELDEDKVKKVCPGASTVTLFRWPEPISPHLAAKKVRPVTNREVIHAVNLEVNDQNFMGHHKLVETAGGVLSPGPGQDKLLSQADLYTSLDLPVIMVGDSNLGGISTTLTALESLKSRNYSVRAVVMFENLGNEGAIETLSGISVCVLPPFPAQRSLTGWLKQACPVLEKFVLDLDGLASKSE
mmetsp:Transcript_89258/g.178393  ORF Transcript_89258/g.178393 Transcript_89258/m.178393 type:complete len:240 (+) Transcript_89258:67-786(+)